MSLEESKTLAIAAINIISQDVTRSEHITVSEIKSDMKQFNVINKNDVAKLVESAKQKYQIEKS